jgi:hypothetical protein
LYRRSGPNALGQNPIILAGFDVKRTLRIAGRAAAVARALRGLLAADELELCCMVMTRLVR